MPVDSKRLPIEIRNLTKTFGAVRALDGLELTVREGEVHGFLGPNGAGKSTTIRILLGVVKADSGTVRLLGGDPWADAVDLHAGRQGGDHREDADGAPPRDGPRSVLRADERGGCRRLPAAGDERRPRARRMHSTRVSEGSMSARCSTRHPKVLT